MQIEIPQYILELIDSDIFPPEVRFVPYEEKLRLSRLLTETCCEEGYGLFTNDCTQEFELEDKSRIVVNFSSLPLKKETWPTCLLERIVRVRQAIADHKESKLLKEEPMESDRYVVPDYVTAVIKALKFNSETYSCMICTTNDIEKPYWYFSRFLTDTMSEETRGVFAPPRAEVFVLGYQNFVRVDFSDIPLNSKETFHANLIERCRRVGQAILDKERGIAKVKSVDPDEGLPSWEEINEMVKHLRLDDRYVRGRFGEFYGEGASSALTGTVNPRGTGVFIISGQYTFDVCCFDNSFKRTEVYFSTPLTPDNLATEIPARIRLVRAARAEALASQVVTAG